MKYLFSVLLVLFSLSSFAKGITDYKIERISIGDSALQFISEKDLLALQKKSDQNSEYKESVFIPNNAESEYSIVSIVYKQNDKNFIIESINAVIYYDKDFDNCFSKKNEVMDEVSNLVNNVEWVANIIDEERMYSEYTYALMKSGYVMELFCNNFSDTTKDYFSIYIGTINSYIWAREK